MKLHEYQAKALFREAGIPCPADRAVGTAAEAVEAAKALGLPVVLKAQVHAGGRGKAGGVKLVSKIEDIKPTAEKILALTIKDLPVRKLLVAPAAEIKKEVYLSILIDRGTRKAVFIGCAEGGVEIEETAKTNPGAILRYEVAAKELRALQHAKVMPFALKLFSNPKQAAEVADIMVRLAKLFAEKDASLIEINPLIADGHDKIVALDAKMIVDDNAMFRHAELEPLRDMDSENQDELDAKAQGLSFIPLDGTIGCMVNGAGLAMATMDTIKHVGGNPANFLDVGGSSSPDKVVVAFRLILKNPKVKAILINIFGGITRCDDIAKGILQSLEQMNVPVPIVVRLVGTNEEEGRKLLEGTKLGTAKSLVEGARKATELGGRA
jgi:succinyl-CoA synthetase beta subunit